MSARLDRQPFEAMGTGCALLVARGPRDAGPALRALAAARAEVAAMERALSRFDPASGLTRLNAAAGRWAAVGPRLADALDRALAAREATGGRFDPTVLPALLAAGYDRSFQDLTHRAPHPVPPCAAGARVDLDVARGRARVARGAQVDLGGVAKGLAAERALAAMRAAWPAMPGALADLGGDIAVAGAPPDGGPWQVAVADPRNPGHPLAVLALEAGGVATSGRDRRRFGPGRALHHLIDPATGRPAAGPLAVTVVAPHAAVAEAHATALAVAGAGEAPAYLAGRPWLGALVVPGAGPARELGRMPVAWRAAGREAA